MNKPQSPVTSEDLGRLLKGMRESLGVSLIEAGRKLNRRPNVIATIESGGISIPVHAWFAMFQVYGGEIKVRGNPPTLILRRG